MMYGSKSAAFTAAEAPGLEPLRWRCARSPARSCPGSLLAGDFALSRHWIELNHQLIVDVWDGKVDAVAEEVYPRLQKLP